MEEKKVIKVEVDKAFLLYLQATIDECYYKMSVVTEARAEEPTGATWQGLAFICAEVCGDLNAVSDNLKEVVEK